MDKIEYGNCSLAFVFLFYAFDVFFMLSGFLTEQTIRRTTKEVIRMKKTEAFQCLQELGLFEAMTKSKTIPEVLGRKVTKAEAEKILKALEVLGAFPTGFL